MLRLGWRKLSLVILAAAFAAVALPQQSAKAQTGNWEYSEAWGGYLDWDTGLVWSEQVGQSSWSSADASSAMHEAETGFPWRLPTVAECQVATAHGIVLVPGVFGFPEGPTWTSDARNKGGARTAHYIFRFYSGRSELWNNNSLIFHIHVYRAFTP